MSSSTERRPSSHSITGDLSKLLRLKELSGKRADMYRLVRGMKYLRNAWMTYRAPINLKRKGGQKNIFRAGHKKGRKKAIFWASRKGKGVRGIILLAPVSDWAAEVMLQGKKRLDQTASVARAFVR